MAKYHGYVVKFADETYVEKDGNTVTSDINNAKILEWGAAHFEAGRWMLDHSMRGQVVRIEFEIINAIEKELDLAVRTSISTKKPS